MERLSLNAFEKYKNFELKRNYIIAFSILFLLLFGWIDNEVFHAQFQNILICLGVALGILMIYFKVTSYFKRENLHGKINGKLIFSRDSILIINTEYPINEIDKIKIEAYDYEDRLLSLYGFDGNRSNGIDNSIEITLKNSKKIYSQFQLNYENQFWKIEDILVAYCKLNKLNYYNLLNVLEINDYNQIQNFKKKHSLG